MLRRDLDGLVSRPGESVHVQSKQLGMCKPGLSTDNINLHGFLQQAAWKMTLPFLRIAMKQIGKY